MKKLLLILLCLPMIGFGQATIKDCKDAYDKEEYSIAVKYCSEVINLDSSNIMAFYMRQKSLQRLTLSLDESNDELSYRKQAEPILKDLNTILSYYPEDADIYYERGTIKWRFIGWNAACDDFIKAKKIDNKIKMLPSIEKALENGECNKQTAKDYFDKAYNNQSDLQYKIDNYTKCLRIDPDYTAAYYNRGSAYVELENYEDAIADYTRVIEIKPERDAYFLRANACRLANLPYCVDLLTACLIETEQYDKEKDDYASSCPACVLYFRECDDETKTID